MKRLLEHHIQQLLQSEELIEYLQREVKRSITEDRLSPCRGQLLNKAADMILIPKGGKEEKEEVTGNKWIEGRSFEN